MNRERRFDHGRWLTPARIVWLIVALGCVSMLVWSLPLLYQSIAAFQGNGISPPDMLRAGLAELGIPEALYVWIAFARLSAVALGFMVTGVILFWRRSDERVVLFFSLQLIVFGVFFVAPAGMTPPPLLAFVANLAFTSFFFSCYLFPDGQFVPRWTRWLLLVWLAGSAGISFFPGTWLDGNTWPPLLGVPFNIGLLVSGPSALIYRYYRRSTRVQRQQIKWAVFGFTAAIASFGAYFMLLSFVPALSASARSITLYDLVGGTLQALSFLLLPLGIGLGLLRYRLWDIDPLINRTLVYGALTTALALTYLGVVVVLQQLFRALTGQQSDLAIVASTLMIAALFVPLRRRIQSAIDRRFYRRKYDAAKALAAFSANVRDEVDLQRLSDHLVAVVEDTMQPAHVSLWLKRKM